MSAARRHLSRWEGAIVCVLVAPGLIVLTAALMASALLFLAAGLLMMPALAAVSVMAWHRDRRIGRGRLRPSSREVERRWLTLVRQLEDDDQ